MSIGLWAAVVYGVALASAGVWAIGRSFRRCRRCRNPRYHCLCAERYLEGP